MLFLFFYIYLFLSTFIGFLSSNISSLITSVPNHNVFNYSFKGVKMKNCSFIIHSCFCDCLQESTQKTNMSLSLNVSFFFIISPSKHVFHCRFQRCAFVSAIIVLQQRGQDIVSCCLLDGVCGWRSIYTLSRTQVWVWWLGCLHSVEKYNLSSLEFEL